MIVMDKKFLSNNSTIKKRQVMQMCKNLKKLIQKTPEEILKETNQYNSIPVNLDVILNKLGIVKIATSFESLEEVTEDGKYREISGLVLLNGDDIGIFYKQTDSVHRKRFTIAHELAHCCLNGDAIANGYIEYRDSFFSKTDPIEIEANTFAGALLIPEHQLKKILKRLVIPSLGGLADIFNVSVNVMRARMRVLNIPFLDDSPPEESDLANE